jgi:hypothetical protein
MDPPSSFIANLKDRSGWKAKPGTSPNHNRRWQPTGSNNLESTTSPSTGARQFLSFSWALVNRLHMLFRLLLGLMHGGSHQAQSSQPRQPASMADLALAHGQYFFRLHAFSARLQFSLGSCLLMHQDIEMHAPAATWPLSTSPVTRVVDCEPSRSSQPYALITFPRCRNSIRQNRFFLRFSIGSNIHANLCSEWNYSQTALKIMEP